MALFQQIRSLARNCEPDTAKRVKMDRGTYDTLVEEMGGNGRMKLAKVLGLEVVIVDGDTPTLYVEAEPNPGHC